MSEQLAWIAFVHAVLFIASMGYAKFLNQKHIHEWYHPDWIWVTVAGGAVLIGLAIVALCVLGILPWLTAALAFSLLITAGIPIVHWQQQQAEQRAKDLEEIERGT